MNEWGYKEKQGNFRTEKYTNKWKWQRKEWIYNARVYRFFSQIFLFRFFNLEEFALYYIGLGARMLDAGLTSPQIGSCGLSKQLLSLVVISHGREGTGPAFRSVGGSHIASLSCALFQRFLGSLDTLKIVARSVFFVSGVFVVVFFNLWKLQTFTKVEKTMYQSQLQ